MLENQAMDSIRQQSSIFKQAYSRCETHGQYPLNFVDAKGIERWRANNCPSCSRQATVARLIAGAQIPERHRHCEFNNYETGQHEGKIEALNICRDYAEHIAEHIAEGRCLLLLGERGNGKNHLATAIAKKALLDHHSVLRVKATEFLDEYWAKEFGSRKQWLSDLAKIDLVILDEVGRHSAGVASHNALFALIDARSETVKPTVLLSNKSRYEIESIITPEGFDRLCEGGGILVRFGWESYRRRKAEA